MKRRFIIYFHYHPNGQADSACRFAVQAVRQAADKLLFVTNGRLDDAGRAWASAERLLLLERENAGFDVGAYRDALQTLGRAGLDEYDEIVLMNYTLAGPVSPVEGLFARMDARPELDFWGLTRHYPIRSRRFGGRRGLVPEHIQSHFIAVRPRMYDAFWAYWQAIRLPASYEESVALHEARFTAHFAALGFRWDTAVDTEAWRGIFVNPLMACPRELLALCGCPFFKRRSFFTPYADELRRTDGLAARQLYDYLRAATDYPVDALLRDLLPVSPLGAMAANLHWRFLLPPGGAAPALPVTELWAEKLHRPTPLEPGRLYYLRLPDEAAGAPGWYDRQNVWQGGTLAGAAALFDREPMLGVLGPSLPLHPQSQAEKLARWRRDLPALPAAMQQWGIRVPLDGEEPLPLPNGGGLLLRGDAFPGGLPPMDAPVNRWLPVLLAQQNGYFPAAAETETQALARADVLAPVLENAFTLKGAAKTLGRAAKRALRR